MSKAKLSVVEVVLSALAWMGYAQAQVGAVVPEGRDGRVASLSKQLRWRDEAGMRQYLLTRDDLTQRLLAEIDGFVTGSFRPGAVAADRVSAGLDTLLGYARGGMFHNVAFLTRPGDVQYLIVGVELWRGPEACRS